MTKQCQIAWPSSFFRISSFGFPSSFVICHSSFVYSSLRRCGASSKCSFWRGRHLPDPSRQFFNHVKSHGDEEDGDAGGGQHAANDDSTQNAPRYCAGTGGGPERHAAKDEGKGGHQNGAQTNPRAGQRSLDQGFALLVFEPRKLDNEDGILGRQTNEHHQTNLRIHVVHHVPDEQGCEGAEDRDGGTEQDAERQRPTFVERREDQEYEQQREPENGRRGNAFLSFFLLERHAHIIVPHFGRHRLSEDVFEHLHCLRGTVSRRGRAVDLSAAIEVIAQRELRAGQGLDGGQRGERHGFAIPVAHVEQPEVSGFGAKFALSLNIDLPLAAKPVEIIYERAAHKRLERFINFAQVHALLQRLVAVHVHEDLRHHWQERGAQAGQFGAFARRFEELVQVAIEELDILPGAILQDEGEATCRANSLNRRRRKRERHRLRKS